MNKKIAAYVFTLTDPDLFCVTETAEAKIGTVLDYKKDHFEADPLTLICDEINTDTESPDDRRGLFSLVEAIAEGEVRVLIVNSLNDIYPFSIVRNLCEQGIRIIAVADGIDFPMHDSYDDLVMKTMLSITDEE